MSFFMEDQLVDRAFHATSKDHGHGNGHGHGHGEGDGRGGAGGGPAGLEDVIEQDNIDYDTAEFRWHPSLTKLIGLFFFLGFIKTFIDHVIELYFMSQAHSVHSPDTDTSLYDPTPGTAHLPGGPEDNHEVSNLAWIHLGLVFGFAFAVMAFHFIMKFIKWKKLPKDPGTEYAPNTASAHCHHANKAFHWFPSMHKSIGLFCFVSLLENTSFECLELLAHGHGSGALVLLLCFLAIILSLALVHYIRKWIKYKPWAKAKEEHMQKKAGKEII